MAGLGDEIRVVRLEKLKKLRALIDPYPEQVSFSVISISNLSLNFKKYMRAKKSIAIAGRMMARREHGGSLFFDLFDGTGSHQVFFAKDRIGSESFSTFLNLADIGDFIAVRGKIFVTKRGEQTLDGGEWQMLAKSLRPLPEKWHGLSDIEERFRKQYLDLLMNPEVRSRFLLRSTIIRVIRTFFDSESFLEVETPMLHHVAGGALARPFITHHHTLDLDLYLRIAPELYLKRLLVGNFPRIYELGKSFRNEGIDHNHNPEFTTIEWYAAYWDRQMMIKSVEQCFQFLMKSLKKKTITYKEHTISFPKTFKCITFQEVLMHHAAIFDYEKETSDSLALKAKRFGIDVEHHASKGKIADEIYKKICRPKIIQPTFIIDHPLDISPLAKQNPNNPTTVLRFQLVVAGLELANAFSELNDPLDQRKRLLAQSEMDKKGDLESHPIDEEFIEALEYGMPPAAGAGIGIDRLVMLFSNTDNIKEVILFPKLRPKF